MAILLTSNIYIEFKNDDNLPVSSIVKFKLDNEINLSEGPGRLLLTNSEYLEKILDGNLRSCGEFCNHYVPYLYINKICQNNCEVVMSEQSELLSENYFNALTNKQIVYKSLSTFDDKLIKYLQNSCEALKKSANTAPNLFIFNQISSQTFSQNFSNTIIIIPTEIDQSKYLCAYHA